MAGAKREAPRQARPSWPASQAGASWRISWAELHLADHLPTICKLLAAQLVPALLVIFTILQAWVAVAGTQATSMNKSLQETKPPKR